METYQLVDSGDGKKWEKFGPYLLCRPCPQAIWRSKGDLRPDALFSREDAKRWTFLKEIPHEWDMVLSGVRLRVAPTDFGHVGVFPEHAMFWEEMQSLVEPSDQILNLFAYSGGATLALAAKGASVCHVDASKGMVDWARNNAAINGLKEAPIRWIVDDAMKFLKREEKRGRLYDGILLDPPTFGRGAKGEVFKIEEELLPLLTLCRRLLSKKPKFLLFTCHTPGFTPMVLQHVLKQEFQKTPEVGEMTLSGKGCLSIPSGSFGKIVYG